MTHPYGIDYCPRCGDHTEPMPGVGAVKCTSCLSRWYATPKCAVEVALFDEDNRLVLTVRDIEPQRMKLDLPGGFVDPQETAEEAVMRELTEELHVTAKQISDLRYITSAVGNYEFEATSYDVLTLQYTANVTGMLKPGDEISGVFRQRLSEVDVGDLAWPAAHGHLLAVLRRILLG
jgi:ADP-ribose pyrophosphatase YjhB (NUDIX family)